MSRENDWEQFKKTGSVNDYLKFNENSNNADFGMTECSGDGCDPDGCDCENSNNAEGNVDLNSNSYEQNNMSRNCFDSYDELDFEEDEAFDEEE